jgi:hypothetical protein
MQGQKVACARCGQHIQLPKRPPNKTVLVPLGPPPPTKPSTRTADQRGTKVGAEPLDTALPAEERPSRLIPCAECGPEIAKGAATCPHCGAPNDWTHPEIVRFLQKRRKFARLYPNFEADGRGFVLIARSTRARQFLDVAADAVGSLGFFAPLSVAGLAAGLGAAIGTRYAAEALREAAGKNGEAILIDFRAEPPTSTVAVGATRCRERPPWRSGAAGTPRRAFPTGAIAFRRTTWQATDEVFWDGVLHFFRL